MVASTDQSYTPFNLTQDVALGTCVAEPEMLDGFFIRRKTIEAAAVEPHERFGTVRIGTLRDH